MSKYEYIAYVDGRKGFIDSENRIFCAASYVIFKNGKEYKRASKIIYDSTVRRLMILASMSAILSIPKGSNLEIVVRDSNSADVISCIKKGKTKDYKLKEKYLSALKEQEINLLWVTSNNHHDEFGENCKKLVSDLTYSTLYDYKDADFKRNEEKLNHEKKLRIMKLKSECGKNFKDNRVKI